MEPLLTDRTQDNVTTGPRRGLIGQSRLLALAAICMVVLLGLCAGLILGGCLHTPVNSTETLPVTPQATQIAEKLQPQTPLPAHTDVAPDATQVPNPLIQLTATMSPSLALEPVSGPITYGHSVRERPLVAYRIGTGPSSRAIVGGIHGGYEWNTVELVYAMLAHLHTYPELVPADVTLYVIPNMNPDGYAAGTDAVVARMNANLVDLNRNWDYQWQPTATHGSRVVNAGPSAFSEPETSLTRDFLLDKHIEMVIFYHSAMGVVFSGAERELSATYELADVLAEATGYPHRSDGVPGQITTGDAIDWCSTVGIAGAEIELTTHESVSEEEWQRNLDGLIAFLNWSVPPSSTLSDTENRDVSQRTVTYTIQSGDTLLQIALEHGVGLEELKHVNDIKNEDQIVEGETLRIPLQGDP